MSDRHNDLQSGDAPTDSSATATSAASQQGGDAPGPDAPNLSAPTAPGPAAAPPEAVSAASDGDVDQRVGRIAELLNSLEDAATQSGLVRKRPRSSDHEDRLVQARLGVASGLFTAIRCRHAPTASHCLRVALGCSAWALARKLSDDQRDCIEIAALLHDVGKIGISDRILLKPGRHSDEERKQMAAHRTTCLEILGSFCTTPLVLETVHFANAWFDGANDAYTRQGEDIPVTARMLAIVDAFDSMTTDHVYRPALSRERALGELYSFAGKQFDPQLVEDFCTLYSTDQSLLNDKVARRWLDGLAKESIPVNWQPMTAPSMPAASSPAPPTSSSIFGKKLVDSMHDAVIYVDSDLKILMWNTGAERLTGVSGSAACTRLWEPALIGLGEPNGNLLDAAGCPVAAAIDTGMQVVRQMSIAGRGRRRIPIDMHAVPVQSSDGQVLGASLLLHDASSQKSLEEKCQALHAEAAKDPLTKVANRAEFDRMLAVFAEAHQESGLPFSLIMADIDHFKSVNDTYGHQAGDEAIVSFATLLKSACRSGDVVARYGGEEFAVLCADCNNTASTRRAEEMRKRFAELDHSQLGDKRITASFGVTELQPGDTPETMLRRADRALLQAKDQGRNKVVQLGDGMKQEPTKKGWWPFRPLRAKSLIDAELISDVPIEVAIRKLRGFISDHEAKLVSTSENRATLEIRGNTAGTGRRKSDRVVPFSVEVTFREKHVERSNSLGFAAGQYVHTIIGVTIRPIRDRDRRRENAAERARLLLHSLRSYLMAKELNADGDPIEVAIGEEE